MVDEEIYKIGDEYVAKFFEANGINEFKRGLTHPFYNCIVKDISWTVYYKISKHNTIWEPDAFHLSQLNTPSKEKRKVVRLELILDDKNIVINYKPIITHDIK